MSIDPNHVNFVGGLFENTKSDVIVITEDKLVNILGRFRYSVKKATDWMTPLSIFITILVTVCTADVNKDFLKIHKEAWSTIFYIGLSASGIFTLISIFNAFAMQEESTVEHVIMKIKKGSHAANSDIRSDVPTQSQNDLLS